MRDPSPLALNPNPGNDRTWTREHWKQVHRYCRVLTPKLNEAMPWKEIEKAHTDLMLYGTASIHYPRR
jgi:hypothetical protein